ncbi:hypothetical protein CAL29_07220 [Bordetella genomosp. 10]|uniref:Uncharacterized protein n=1 Tax=Bordetella genomosp. 10 TaxID=1416804 RepID=A0A261SL46_9BORD|nr:hypothetical protein [Bordetella genomosp. 10]OZI38126.1 hypothetical protein CAL29_07220 [Bordetella genomosp. 10]
MNSTEPSADPVFTELLCHAISVRKFSPQLGVECRLWDMPSTGAVVRCVIEARAALEYIPFSEISDKALTFRMLI